VTRLVQQDYSDGDMIARNVFIALRRLMTLLFGPILVNSSLILLIHLYFS